MKKNIKYLENALNGVISFLKATPNSSWVGELEQIQQKLSNKDSVDSALKDLNSCFGGMGSLNDLVFCKENKNLPDGLSEKEYNKKFEKLLDRLFKGLRLISAPWYIWIDWNILAWKYRKDIPPRIKNSFRK